MAPPSYDALPPVEHTTRVELVLEQALPLPPFFHSLKPPDNAEQPDIAG